ncbi:MAG: hypothetical protein M3R55_00585 [Acidobacteriota bacterium]|nr:hypothetical protein [Acidobacteriota bacterium]
MVTAVAALVLGIDLSTHAHASGALTVVVRSTASPRPPLRVGVDAGLCGESVPDESIVMTRGLLASAVVRLPGLKGTQPPALDIVNDKCRFVPHVALAAPGATLRMVSRDQTLHTVHAQHEGKSLFNVGLPVPGMTVARPANGRGPVALKCNTHPWMSGHVYLTDERATLSSSNGVAEFDQVPEGTHTVAVWHETLGTGTAQAKVVAGQTTKIEITLGGK